MAEKKRVFKLPVVDTGSGVETFVPVGMVEGRQPGPTFVVSAGVHASEYAAQDGAKRFWDFLDPEMITGTVYVVLAADVTALCAHHIYTNPIDGKNLNRIWPGKKDGTLSERIAYTIFEEVLSKADAVVDCHGGEFDESMGLYVLTCTKGDKELDKRTLALAEALGVPFIEVLDADGPWLGSGTLKGEVVKRGCPAMTIEAGERGFRHERAIAATFNALKNAARHLGILPGEPVQWAGKPVFLKEGAILKSSYQGLLESRVVVGDWIEEGEVFATIRDFDGTLLEEILAPKSGTVLTVIIARAVKADGFIGKIGVV